MIKEKELNWNEYASSYEERIVNELNENTKSVWTEELIGRIGIDKGKVLDVGTGPGFFSIILAKKGFDVIGIDSSEDMLKQACKNAAIERINVNLRLNDAENVSFEDETFDAVISRNVSYALSYPEKAYREWKRVLKKGGKILIYDANWFNFIYNDEERKKVDIFLTDYHIKKGCKHPTYEIEADIFRDHIASRPLSRKNRPFWDVDFWKNEGVAEVRYDMNIGLRLYGENFAYENMPTPFFVIEVIK
ncbi:MAG: class I SAM-dependent methyltransferase [Eubacterium sp.]|jgi:ubiquinone/menaquinone biosynthesis C-methylase UbiE|nr:class I SAM-dependent methyltransferase [Eubacterium sp.]